MANHPSPAATPPFRIGIGFDIHRLVPCPQNTSDSQNVLWLGGVPLHAGWRAIAHSDGDVLLHALCDALLSAMGLPDIGKFFPPDDPTWKNIPSTHLLQQVLNKIPSSWQIVQVHGMIFGELVRIAPYRTTITQKLQQLLTRENASPPLVSLHATTLEGLGLTTNQPGIAALCQVVLWQVHSH